jgi:hypothetical protein
MAPAESCPPPNSLDFNPEDVWRKKPRAEAAMSMKQKFECEGMKDSISWSTWKAHASSGDRIRRLLSNGHTQPPRYRVSFFLAHHPMFQIMEMISGFQVQPFAFELKEGIKALDRALVDGEKGEGMIQFPMAAEKQRKVIAGFEEALHGMSQCVGAIDGTSTGME